MGRKKGRRRRRSGYRKGRGLVSDTSGRKNPSQEETLRTTASPDSFRYAGKIEKVDDGLGLVFGWAMICKRRDENGVLQEYVDLHGNAIDEDGMVESLADFMVKSQEVRAMHRGRPRGTTVFAFPMTEEIAKVYGFENVPMTGALFAARPDPESMQKFLDGSYTGFSIGGVHLEPPDPLEAR
jgi:hypothetical protein